MTRNDIANIVKQVVSAHFSLSEIYEHQHIWNDFEADDLAYIEIFMVLEEVLNCCEFDCLEFVFANLRF